LVNNVITGCVLLMLIGSAASSDAVPPGFLEGHVKIFPLSDVNLADDATAAKAETEQPYSEYPLIIRSRDRKKEITQVTVNRNGNYRVELPPGDYVLDVQGPESKPVRVKPRPFTVVSNQTVRVDMDIDTGIR
jgi:hypothetical protein